MDDDPWGAEPSWARGDGDDEDEDGEDDTPAVGATHVLVMIDCNPSMFVPSIRLTSDEDEGDEGDDDAQMNGQQDEELPSSKEMELVTPFEAALRATEKLLRFRVNSVATSRGGTRDGIGVMLYATKKFRPEDKQREQNGEGRDLSAVKKVDRAITGSDEDEESSDDDDEFDADEYMSSTYQLIPLAPPGTEQMLQIRGCIPGNVGSGSRVTINHKRDLVEEFADIETRIDPAKTAEGSNGIQSLCPLRSALHEASKAFLEAKCVKKQAATSKNPGDSKSLWIFTNEDNPCKDKEVEKEQVVIVAKDAVDNGLEINVWPLPRLNAPSPFDRTKFFDLITTKDVYSEPSYIENTEGFAQGEMDLDDLLEDIDRSWKKVRKAQTLQLFLPGWENRPANPGIMVDLIRPVQVKRKPVAITVNQATNKRTDKKTDYLGKDSDAAGEIINLDRLRYYTEFGGTRVPMSKDEVDLMKQKANANEEVHSLILNGFKPIHSLPKLNFQNTYLAYPNEEKVIGSRSAFTALHAAMLRKQVWAVGELLLRAKKATSRLVAMVPQAEERDEEDGTQISPPGIILYSLPFEDDIRAIDEGNGDTADETLVNKAVELIRHQQMRGVDWGASFENPALTDFWNYIESIAIDIPLQQSENALDVDPDAILANARAQIEDLEMSLPEDEVKTTTRKRKAPTVDDSGVNWRELYDTDGVKGCSMATLKKYLGSVGEKVSGKKDELVERVKNSIVERIAAGTMPGGDNTGDADNAAATAANDVEAQDEEEV
mmetsp:Transcript_11578/g.25067  ORF Transcript_11578/g.25067 Transcript_11578/m.25067 type:complete len:773 (+) Transcript_11578:166-2484(+)